MSVSQATTSHTPVLSTPLISPRKRRDRKIEEKYRRDSADALKAALGDPYTKDKILADVPIRTWAMEMMRHCRDFGFTTEGQFMGHIWNQLYPDLQELCTKPNNQTRNLRVQIQSCVMPVVVLTDHRATRGIVTQTSLRFVDVAKLNMKLVTASTYLSQFQLSKT